ncbi:uncharacterized protein C2845_PM11G03980 [Panicum miliaceum]|uniref:Clp R domain-containing protein n=1 Tax=Panicum miliaceum TaxID=4540 RepID=A0A3L6RU00_PANMI|nr:uncharacterized protein C2845_PM11G03980 [Panicum miliaceum]
MRAGGYTVHQSLTAEAAAVLKLSLGLARRRGHAQVTPLHVAYTMLSGASLSSPAPLFATAARASTPAYGLLWRACARTHMGGGARGAQPPQYPSHPAQCRALELCFNVALNRLPTANAVAGSPLSSPSSSSASSTSFAASILHHPSPTLSNALVAALKRAQANQRRGCPCGHGGGASWPAPSLNYRPDDVELQSPSKEEDVRAILEVMSRTYGRRTNPVVVGDSVSVAEASVAALLRSLEGGDVPDELRGARVLRLHLSHVHVRLMAKADVDACVADLRRTVAATAATTNTRTGGLVIYVGDMRWAVDEDDDEARAHLAAYGVFSPAAHLAAELARLLGELRAASYGGRAWLVAAASYGTYMRCQQRSSLQETWALQPVAVPAGAGLGLGLTLGPRAATSQTDGVPVLCDECATSYETEASAARAKAEGTNLALTFFPGWPQADEPQTSHKDDLMELKRKWSRLCRRVHLQLQHSQPTRPSNATTTSSNPGLRFSFGTREIKHQDVKTTLSLLPPDSAHPLNEDTDAKQATTQESDPLVDSRDMKNALQLWTDEQPSGDLKRKAVNVPLPRESKRWRGGCGLDLNLCADDEENQDVGRASSEDELVPSDLTNNGESSGDVGVTDSLGSHC